MINHVPGVPCEHPVSKRTLLLEKESNTKLSRLSSVSCEAGLHNPISVHLFCLASL